MDSLRLFQDTRLVSQVGVEAVAPPTSEEVTLEAWAGGVGESLLPAQANPALLTQPSLVKFRAQSLVSSYCLPDRNVLITCA